MCMRTLRPPAPSPAPPNERKSPLGCSAQVDRNGIDPLRGKSQETVSQQCGAVFALVVELLEFLHIWLWKAVSNFSFRRSFGAST